MYTNFSGRIIQLIEALDYGDAVSKQAIRLQQLLKNDFGISSEIYSKYAHKKVSSLAKPLQNLSVDEKDIVFYHFSGFAQFTGEVLERLYCTKVLIYHNITPEYFFKKGTKIYNHCKQGRMQVEKILPLFHFFVGISHFDLENLLRLGVDSSRTSVLPILVPTVPQTCQNKRNQGLKKWLFVGRIAPNKRQDLIIEKFSEYQTIYGGTHKLYLVGNFDENDWYYKKLRSEANKPELKEKILITGKVSDDELINYYQQADIFLSLSEHEGFGVPLIEACNYGVPVVALEKTAVSETLQGSPGLVKKTDDIIKCINRVFFNEAYKGEILEYQNIIKERYGNKAIKLALSKLLKRLLPDPCLYSTVSVVICTYNRAPLLERCLDYLRYQTNSNFEVIVVNGPSEDSTDEVLEKYKGKIKIAKTNLRNLSASRNLGIELAAADIIAFIDDDAIPYDDWIDRLLNAYNSLPLMVAGVGGPAFYAGSLEFQEQDHGFNSNADVEFDIARINIDGKKWHRYTIGTNCSFKKEALYKIGGFDEQYDYFLDETDLCFRLQNEEGYLVHYNNKLFVRHEFAQSHNRKSTFNYNWRTICKNTAYFILKANAHKNAFINSNTIKKKLHRERIAAFEVALSKGFISHADKETYTEQVYEGMERGISDAKAPRRIRALTNKSQRFVQFEINHNYPIVRKTIKPLHILFLSKEFPPFLPGGGIGTLYYNLTNELLQMGHWVSVIIPGEKSEYRRGRFSLYSIKQKPYFGENELRAPVVTKNLNWACSAANCILAINKHKKIDLVDSAIWDFEAFALPILDLRHEIPLVLRLVTPFKVAAKINGWKMSAIEKALFEKAEKDLIASADVVVAISKSIAKTVQDLYQVKPDTRWKESYIGIAYWPSFDVNSGYCDLQEMDNQLQDIPSDAFLVLFLGRLEKRKGIDIFLDAAFKYCDKEDKVYFLVAGNDVEGWQARLDKKIDRKRRKRIVFFGNVDDRTKEKLYNLAKVLVFPSRYESFGLVPLEAFVHGTPVIASRSGAIPEIVEEGKSGLLYEADNPKELMESINKLYKDKHLYANLCRGTRETAKRFSSREMAINSVRIYAELLANR